ncbi:MAG: SGNH/GDSL hydrolase family protein, partial [Prevotella sp.]|nr:SGNH/GDSL hydrolase family protein [Prevotella sp.]
MVVLLCAAFALEGSSKTVFTHPWQGKRVAYFGDSITDPRNSGSKIKYWGYLADWLDIKPYV